MQCDLDEKTMSRPQSTASEGDPSGLPTNTVDIHAGQTAEYNQQRRPIWPTDNTKAEEEEEAPTKPRAERQLVATQVPRAGRWQAGPTHYESNHAHAAPRGRRCVATPARSGGQRRNATSCQTGRQRGERRAWLGHEAADQYTYDGQGRTHIACHTGHQ